jgi:hypothetical protein
MQRTRPPRPLETAVKTALYGASYAIRLDSPPEDTHPAHGKVYRAYWGRLTATVRGSVTPFSATACQNRDYWGQL